MATQPTTPSNGAVEKKKKARNEMGDRGPNPAHILLDAISGALKGGVGTDKVVLLVDMARQAYGTDQGLSWKMIAKTLRENTEEAAAELDRRSERLAQQLSDATTTLPDDSPDAG